MLYCVILIPHTQHMFVMLLSLALLLSFVAVFLFYKSLNSSNTRVVFITLFILLGLVSTGLRGNNKAEIYDCYFNNRMPVWKSLIDQLNNQPDQSNELLLELVNYQYGYIGWCLESKRKEEANIYLKLAEKNVKVLEENRFELSLVNAYKAALFGFHIAINKFSAPLLGPKSYDCAQQAILLDPNQPFGYIQLGNVQLHTPALMGGSKTEAINHYLKAKLLMEKKGRELRGDWNYLNLITIIARAYESVNDLVNAKLVYEEILKFEPGFILVRDELYPKFLKK